MIIVTKCPNDITEIAQEKIKKRIGLDIPIYFSFIDYDTYVYNETDSVAVSEIKDKSKVLLVGIAKPKPFIDFLKADNDLVITYPDHHHYTNLDIESIKKQAGAKIIITTEKDFVRLDAEILQKQFYYLPIKSCLVSQTETFDETILHYVGTCTRNR
jgi:tetraacyldisaccharide 4'-kinase